MSLETINRLAELTGRTNRTVKSKLEGLKPFKRQGKGKAYLYQSKKALPLIFDIGKADHPIEEKARLDRLRGDEVEHRLGVARQEVAPIAILEWVLSNLAEQISSIRDSLPLRIKKRAPKLSARDIEMIRREIVKAQNAASSASPNYSEFEAKT